MLRVLVCFAIFFPTACFGNDCPGPNKQQVSKEALDFTFESWVKAPEPGNIFFTYGRCVATNNGQFVRVYWPEAGLRGTARQGQPLRLDFPFVGEDTVPSVSRLGFGINSEAENTHDVSILAHSKEIISNEFVSFLTSTGQLQPENVQNFRAFNLESSSSLPVEDENGVQGAINVVFRSNLFKPGGSLRQGLGLQTDDSLAEDNSAAYEVFISVDGELSERFLSELMLDFSGSEFLTQALFGPPDLSVSRDFLPSVLDVRHIRFGNISDFSTSTYTNIVLSPVGLYYRGEIIAGFIVSHYVTDVGFR